MREAGSFSWCPGLNSAAALMFPPVLLCETLRHTIFCLLHHSFIFEIKSKSQIIQATFQLWCSSRVSSAMKCPFVWRKKEVKQQLRRTPCLVIFFCGGGLKHVRLRMCGETEVTVLLKTPTLLQLICDRVNLSCLFQVVTPT